MAIPGCGYMSIHCEILSILLCVWNFHKNILKKYLWDIFEAVTRGKFIVLNTFINKNEAQIYINSKLKKLQRE